jgi:trehalose 6-phosphate synthase
MSMTVVSNATPNGGAAGGVVELLKMPFAGRWYGWNREVEPDPTFRQSLSLGQKQVITSAYSPEEYQYYYNGFANKTAWGGAHRFGHAQSENDLERQLLVANSYQQRLARKIALDDQRDPTTIKWIHDYQNSPLIRILRKMGVQGPFGFSQHIPQETYAELAMRSESSPAMAHMIAGSHKEKIAADLISFQTPQDLENYAEYGEKGLGAVYRGNSLFLNGHRTRLIAQPVGITPEDWLNQPSLIGDPEVEELRRKIAGRALGFMFGRLDPSKGTVPFLQAVLKRVQQDPARAQSEAILVVLQSSRKDVEEYQELDEQIAVLEKEINKFSMNPEQPLLIVHRDRLSHPQICTLLKDTRVGFVPSIWDGFCLVLSEMLAGANPENPLVVVSGKNVGAARTTPGVLKIDPNDIDSFSEMISHAFAMSQANRIKRREAAMPSIFENNASKWRETITDAIRECGAGASPKAAFPQRYNPRGSGLVAATT